MCVIFEGFWHGGWKRKKQNDLSDFFSSLHSKEVVRCRNGGTIDSI